MSMNINSLRTSMRFSGLASGLDTDSMVRDLMRVQRMKVDKLFQNRQTLQWQQEDYRSMNGLLNTLRNKSFDMRLQSAYRKFNVTSSNDSVVSASAAGNASEASYTFNSVTKLASSATMVSAPSEGPISTAKGIVKGNPFSVPTFTYPVGVDAMPDYANRFQVKLNGGEYVDIDLAANKTYNSNADLVVDIQAALNSAGVGAIKAHVTTDNRLVFTSANASDTFSIKAVTGSSMLGRLGIPATDTVPVSSRVEKLDQTLSFADLSSQGRLNSIDADFGWTSNVSARFDVVIPEDAIILNVALEELKVGDNPGNISVKLNGMSYSVYTGEDEVPQGAVRLSAGGIGETVVTFAPNAIVTEGSVIEVERKDFSVTLSNYNQDGVKLTETFKLNARTESFSALMASINGSPTLGLSAFYDETSDRVSLTSKWKGNNNVLGDDIEVDGFLAKVLKLDPSKGGHTDGQDAEFALNGLATTRKDNVFSINGVTFTLKQATTPGQSINLSVGQDFQSVFNAVDDFVKIYNETLDGINIKLMEERFSGYPPLTDEQKSVMSERDIEKWDEKSRSGMLKGDTMLQGMLDDMRRLWSDPVNGLTNDTMKQLTSVGIFTGSYSERGRLTIDKDRLMAAIEKDPDGVTELFTKTGTTTNEQGIASRLHTALTAATKRISDRAGSAASLSRIDSSAIGESIKRINQRIDSETRRLIGVEDRYWRQFTALETAMSKMNSQSSWLAQQFGSQ